MRHEFRMRNRQGFVLPATKKDKTKSKKGWWSHILYIIHSHDHKHHHSFIYVTARDTDRQLSRGAVISKYAAGIILRDRNERITSHYLCIVTSLIHICHQQNVIMSHHLIFHTCHSIPAIFLLFSSNNVIITNCCFDRCATISQTRSNVLDRLQWTRSKLTYLNYRYLARRGSTSKTKSSQLTSYINCSSNEFI
jgi:hypothetical protein